MFRFELCMRNTGQAIAVPFQSYCFQGPCLKKCCWEDNVSITRKQSRILLLVFKLAHVVIVS